MRDRSVQDMAAALSLLLHQKLGVTGGGLEAKLARAGRALPKTVRRQGKMIAEAEKLATHPKLSRQTDPVALSRAFAKVEKHLKGIDTNARRKTALLNLAGRVALNLFVVAGALLAFLVWQEFL